jgi:predicted permease
MKQAAESLGQDLRYALRSLARRPVVTSVALLSLALGIGVNSAIFSVFDRLLLRRLPVPSPEAIVLVTSPGPRPGGSSTGDGGGPEAVFSYPLFRDLERLEQTGLSPIAAHRDFAANLAYRGQTSNGEGFLVSGGYFPVLGITPALGRLLVPDDDRVPGAHPVVVLAHAYWSARFGANPAVLNETLIVNGEPMTIVGVAPAGFTGTTTMKRPQIFAPLAMAARMRPAWQGIERRNDHWLYLFARLDATTTREQAQGLINVPFSAILRDVELPVQRSGMGERVREQFLARRIVLEEGARGGNAARDETRTILLLLLAVTGFVLLIACANVANLLMARAADRANEVGVRQSVGASTWQLLRLFLTEACLLGALGGVAALVVARATLGALLAIMPADDGPLLEFELNTTMLIFTLALGLGTGLLFGLFPALHAVRVGPGPGMSGQPGRASRSRADSRYRTGLATAQIALATALLAQAGLLIASLANVAREELGIRREGLATFRISPYLNGYTRERELALFERLEDQLRGTPGVMSVGTSTTPLLADTNEGRNVSVEGFQATPDTNTTAWFARTGPGYFAAVGIPLLAGRDFTRADAGTAPKVAIVNEAFARKFQLGSQVVGKHLAIGAGGPLDIEIVGVVRDAKYAQVREPAPPQLFVPYRQGAVVGRLSFYVRTTTDARQLVSAIPAQVGRLDGNLPVENLRTMDDQIWENVTTDRVLATLSSSFAGLATFLAGIGLYAVLSYSVTQRGREIGIRMAVGARAVDVGVMVLSHVGRITLVGGAIGAALALGLGRLGQALLFGIEGFDLRAIGAATLVVVVVALLAGLLPARRAARIEPTVALRAE